jgi:hypothetical protein
MAAELEALAQRLEEAEKQIAHLAALAVGQSDTDRTVVARNFLVKDARGQARANLGMTASEKGSEEWPSLAIFDPDGNVCARIGVGGDGVGGSPRGPWLELWDTRSEAVVKLKVDETGPGVWLYNAKGKPAVHLAGSEDGSSICLFDRDGKKSICLNVSPSGSMSFLMSEAGTIETQPTVGPSLKLATDQNGASLQFGKDNKVIWSAP